MTPELKELRQQLAEAREACGEYIYAEVDLTSAIREIVSAYKERNETAAAFHRQLNEQEALFEKQLAASQAREKLLREALEAVQGIADQSDGIVGWHLNGDVATWASLLPEVPNAIVLPSDDTALRQAIRLAKEEMRERAAKVCEDLVTPTRLGGDPGRAWIAGTFDCAEAIRALEVE